MTALGLTPSEIKRERQRWALKHQSVQFAQEEMQCIRAAKLYSNPFFQQLADKCHELVDLAEAEAKKFERKEG